METDTQTTKMKKNLKKVLDLFQPNENGQSDWVSVKSVRDAGLSWSDNGNVRRGVALGVSEYNWEFKRLNGRHNGTILEMRLDGKNNSLSFNQRIRKDIIDELRKKTTSNFAPNCIVPLVENDKEIDHRWGRKDHLKYEYISDIKLQTIDDFQLLSHSHNQFKREQCVKCKNTNIRYPTPNNQPYAIGCQNWEDAVGCSGCPLAQPELYF